MSTASVKTPKATGTPADRATKTAIEFPETKLTSAEIEDKLIKARIEMLISAPFFGNLATRLGLRDATKWCPTIATDGKYFYYNRNFVAALANHDDDQVVFGVGHEVLHCVYDHMDPERRGDRHPVLWNIANDYVVNDDLVEAGIGKKIDLIEICYDHRYRGKFSEEIYDILYKKYEDEGKIVKINMDTFDMHLDREEGDDAGSGKGDGDGDGDDYDGNGPAKFSAEEKERIKQEFKNAVIQSAKAAGASSLPGGVRKLLDKYLNPKLNWRELIAMQIQSVFKSDYTFKYPSRKGMDAGMYLPGMDYDTTIDIGLAIDVSGSIDDSMVNDFLSETKGIMDQYTNFRIHLLCFDTVVHNPREFTESNMDEFMDYNIEGGGGTDFDCVFNYFKDNGITPKKLVMFTDGYPWGSWGDENFCDTLFIVHGGHGDRIPEAPFGITVDYTKAVNH